MRKEVDLSVIILNYNTKDLLRECLKSVVGSNLADFADEIIVVDNASSDGSPEMVKKEFSKVILIINRENLGFSAGNNVGIKRAKGRYLLFLNPDTLVEPQTFKIMLDFMEQHPRVGAATCKIELPNGQLDNACHRGFPTPWNALCYFSGLGKIFPRFQFFNGYTLACLDLNSIHQIDSACGAFLIVRRQAGEEVAWWDEDYFWYGEDLDFCYRLKEKGWQVMFVPKAKIIHYKGAASGIKKESQEVSTATEKTRIKATKASIKVMRIFYKKHYQKKYPKVIYWLVMVGVNLLEKIRLSRL